MAKNLTNRSSRKPLPAFTCSGTRRLTLLELIVGAKTALRELVVQTGLQVFGALLEEDRTVLCGPKSQPQPDRGAYRHGHDEGTLVFGGRKVRIQKPRVRSVNGKELELPIWQGMSNEDPMQQRVLEQILVGVSTRGYERSLESVAGEAEPVGVSRSSVSRHFVAKTSQEVDRFLSRSLEGLDLPVIMIDGKGFADHMLVTALGIDATGKKHVLGLTEGTTESEGVCRSLLQNLVERGLAVERARLFVIDGGKGIRKGLRATFGHWALIQRCQEHKLRNVLEHLPESKREWLRAAMRRGWEADTVEKARSRMKGLASQLRVEHPGASASILEGMEETLTLIALGVRGSLLRTLRSTNPIENLQGALQKTCRNVKRWRGGAMIMRWGATALMEAEKKFRRIAGYKSMGLLIAALDAKVSAVDIEKAAA